MSYPWYRSGTITLTNANATVVGVDVLWSNAAYARPGDGLYRKTDDGLMVLVDEIVSIDEANELTLANPWGGATLEDIEYAIMPNGIARSSSAMLNYNIATFTQSIVVFTSGEGAPADEDGQNGWGYLDTVGNIFYLKVAGEWNDGTSLVGPQGPQGPTTTGTSTTSLAIEAGSKSLAASLGRAWAPGSRLRLSSAANPSTHYMDLVCGSYDAETGALTGTVSAGEFSGSGSRSDWSISLVGDKGAKGDTGASYAATSSASLAIATGSKAFTGVGTGLAYVAGQRVRASSLADASNQMEGVVASYSGGTLTLTVDRINGSGTFDDWQIGLIGAVGATGPSYAATSATSRAIGTGSMSFTTQANLAYVAGMRVRLASAANPTTHYMEGVVTAYSGTSLTVTVDNFAGSGSRADWLIGIAGDKGATGAAATIAVGEVTTVDADVAADVNNVGTSSAAEFDFIIPRGKGYGGSSTTSLAIGTGTKTFTTQAGLAYPSVGARVRATSAADADNWMEGPATYSSTTLEIEVDLIGPSATGTHDDWVFSITGERGAAGAGNVDSVNGQTGAVTLEAAHIGADAPSTGYAPASANVQGHFEGIGSALAAAGAPGPPQGRLTLSAGVPVMTSTVADATTIRYTPYIGRFVPLWNGTRFVMADIGGELTQLTTDTTKSPAVVANNSNYDLFVWDDSGTKRCTRGPAWSSSTARGTGTGTTELELVNGILVNKYAITNGPAAQRGTYVGTVRSNGSAQIDYVLGGSGSGGVEAKIHVWNMYNRVPWDVMVQDTSDSWTYATANFRASNNSNTNRVSMVFGLVEDAVVAEFHSASYNSSNNAMKSAIGLDSVSTPIGTYGLWNGASIGPSVAFYRGHPGLGSHYLQALEWGNTNSTFCGDNGAGTVVATGLLAHGLA